MIARRMQKDESRLNYMIALGSFIHTFTDLERLIHELMVDLAQMPRENAKVLLASFRATAAFDAVLKIQERQVGTSLLLDFIKVRRQFKALNELRNALVHFQAAPVDDGGWEILDAFKKPLSSSMAVQVGPDRLAAAVHDLGTIYRALLVGRLQAQGLDADKIPSSLVEAANKDWRYDPSSMGPRSMKSVPEAEWKPRWTSFTL